MDPSRRDALRGLALVASPLLAAAACSKAPNEERANRSSKDSKRTPRLNIADKTPKVSERASAVHSQAQPSATSEPEELPEYMPASQDSIATTRISLTSVLPDREMYRALRYKPSSLKQSFRWNHADVLLDSAHALLNRALDARSEWQDRYLKFHTFISELDQFEALDAIHREETLAGFYETDAAVAHADMVSVLAMMNYLSNAVLALTNVADRVGNEFSTQSGAEQLLGWLSHVSAYASTGATAQATWNGVTKSVIDHCFDATVALAQHGLNNQQDRSRAEAAARNSDQAGLQERYKGLAAKAAWEAKNVAFRKRRTDALRAIYAQKRALFAEKGGGLDFQTQLASALKRCERDYSDGLEHAAAADLGLQRIFGYEHRIPPVVARAMSANGPEEHPPAALDEAIEWARNASSWLTHFVQRDALSSISLSLKRLVLPGEWQDFLRSGHLMFILPEDLLPHQAHVRFRGVSLHVVEGRGLCGAALKIPEASFYRMRDGSTHSVNQEDIPIVRIGAVRRYDSARPPEVAGMSAAYNISPIGKWHLSLSDLSSQGETLRELGDVIFELTMVASN
jgi:hypothetical protein